MKKIDKIIKKDENKKNKSVMSKRKHINIKANNYSSVFSSRNKTNKAYEDYTTKKGLYEPVTPYKGAKIKKEV